MASSAHHHKDYSVIDAQASGAPLAYYQKICLIFSLLLIIPASQAWSSVPVVLEKNKGIYPVGLHLQYHVDKDGKAELQELMAMDKEIEFIDSKRLNLNFGFTQVVHWVRFSLVNPFGEKKSLLLEFAHPHMDSVKIYIVRDGQEVGQFEGGDTFPYGHREIDYHNLVFPMQIPANSTTQVYMRFQTQGSMQIPVTLWEPVAFAEKAGNEQLFLGLYFGVMFAMFFYNLFLFIFLRDVSYLFYVLYMFFLILVQLSIDRLDVQYLWPDLTVFANLSFPAFYNLAFFFGGVFSRNFLNTRTRAPVIDKLILLLMGIALYGLSATILMNYNAGFAPVLYILAIFEPLVLFAAGIQCWRKGVIEARYYTIAWSALLISALVFNLRNITVLPSIFITDYSLYFGSAIEVIFLSLALGDRINAIKAEKILAQKQAFEAQQRFTDELETQVKQRTLELEDSNKKLERLSNLDGLTGLFNRRYFDRIMQKEWKRLQRSGQPLSLVMADVDFFKRFNDTYGHPAGDECLRAVAEAMEQAVRRSSDVAARYGGEEFTLILPGVTAEGAKAVVQKISAGIQEKAIPHKASKIKSIVTMSFGIATMIPDKGVEPEALIRLSDKALYQSKEAGRNTITTIASR